MMTTLTLVGFGAAILWLRWRVAGERGMGAAALLAALLSMNLNWLLGFSSFMLGACLFAITLGIWWTVRDRLDARRIAALATLLALGYFCHLASLVLTMVGLVVLSVASPIEEDTANPWRGRGERLAKTSLSFIPSIVLGFLYLRIARQGGQVQPVWRFLVDPRSLTGWAHQLAWVDPLTLAVKDGLPFTDRVNKAFILFAPVLWLAVAIIMWWYGRMSAGPQSAARQPAYGPGDLAPISPAAMAGGHGGRQAWTILAALLVIAGVICPDSLGAAHGDFLPQRVVLLGFVALVPVFDVDPRRWPGRTTIAALAVAVALQSACIWDYALYCDATAGQIIRAADLVGREQRIVTLLTTSRGRYRANSLLHAENWLGVDTGNIVWNNYETLHYYFPVQFRAGIERPHPGDLELVSLHEEDLERESRLRDWEGILSRYADTIDVILIWKRNEPLERIANRWFRVTHQRGDVQILRRQRPTHK
jgi:hypothetical protein